MTKIRKLRPAKKENKLTNLLTCAEKTAIDSSLIKFLCGCNIPFDVLDSTHFKEFVKLLRSAYKHLSKRMINNTLLNSVYNQLMTDPSMCEQSKRILMISSSMSQKVDLKHIVGTHCWYTENQKKSCFLKFGQFQSMMEIVHDAVQISKEKYKSGHLCGYCRWCMSANCEFNNPWFFKCQATITMKIVNLFKTIPFISKVQNVLNGFQTPWLKEEITNFGGVEFEVVDNEASIFLIKNMFINCLKNICIFKQILNMYFEYQMM